MTKADYGLLLREYFVALNIGHAGVMLTLHSAEYYPIIVDNRLFIDKPNDHFTNNGFSDKDEIIAINNTPIDRYIQSIHLPQLTLIRRTLLNVEFLRHLPIV